MKLRTRFYLYIIIISFMPLLGFLLVCLELMGPEEGLFTFGKLFLLEVGVALGVGYWAYQSIAKKVKHLKHEVQSIVKAQATGEFGQLPYISIGNDELGQLKKLIWDAFSKQNAQLSELESNYRKIQYSKMDLEEKYAQSYTLQLILEEISRELDIDQLLKKTSDIIIGVFGSKRCTIYMVDDEMENLVPRASSGGRVVLKEISLQSDNIIVRACLEKQVFTERDFSPQELAEILKQNIRSILVIPLTGRNNNLGTLVIEHEQADGISRELTEFARNIAQELSLSVENSYLYIKMKHMAIHDGLTGVYNRMYLMNYMMELFANRPNTVTVILWDLDHFKSINDRYGHLTGDLVLKTFTAIVQKILPTGILARYGGEEFVILLPEVPQDSAFNLAQSIRWQINEYPFTTVEGMQISVTASAGIANYPLITDNYEGLMQLADDALYQAKETGRNKVCVAKKSQPQLNEQQGAG